MVRIPNLAAAMLIVGLASASGAQAQVAFENGLSVTSTSSSPALPGTTAIDLGDYSQSTTQTLVSQMPMSLSYGDVNLGISFTGRGGLYDGGTYAPGSGNYLIATMDGAVTLDFSRAQTYFETRWTSQDPGNSFAFYNGDQLVASVLGSQLTRPASGTSTVAFSFTDLGFDRVVASTTNGGLEFGELRFAGPAPEVAPIPLNAASMGGLMSFLMMLGMWGKGGARHMLRMTFASITPRRRALTA